MVRSTRVLMTNALNKTLFEIMVCPLTKQPLRYCEKTGSLISDRIGVSYPIVNGIPCLVPKDGKILEEDELSTVDGSSSLSSEKTGIKGAAYEA